MSRFEKLQKEFEKVKTDIAITKSKLKDITNTLIKDFGCKTIAEAYKKVDKLQGKSEAIDKTIEALLTEAEALIDGEEEEED